MTPRELCEKIEAAARAQQEGLLDLCSVCPQRSFFLALVIKGLALRVFRIKARGKADLYIRCLAFDGDETTQVRRLDATGPPTERQVALASKLVRELLRLKRGVASAVYNLAQSCPRHTFDLYARPQADPTFVARFWVAKHRNVLGGDFADRSRHYFRAD